MKVCVTGGAGFIGGHIVEKLYNYGIGSEGVEQIIIVDDLSLGPYDRVAIWLEDNLNEDGVIFMKSIHEFVKSDYKVDIIMHLGMPSSSPMYRRDPKLVGKVVNEMLMLLEYASKHNSRIVLASTSSMYNGNPLPWREDMPIHVMDYYTESRYYAERLCKLYSIMKGLEVVVLRLFSVYGPGEEHKGQYANLVSQFIWCFLNKEKPVIFGDGTQTRDFICVYDVVDAFMKAATYEFQEEPKFEVFNVGTGKETTLNDLVRILQKELDMNIEPEYVPNPITNYVYRQRASISKAWHYLKFRAKWQLKDGIRRTIEYYVSKMIMEEMQQSNGGI